MTYTVTLIPGDGIGPELSEATVGVLEATGISFAWEVQQAGEATIASEGTPLPDRVIESIRRNGVAIKGPITTPVGGGFRSVNVGLRIALELYANVRPAHSMVGVETRYTDVDLIIVRENTEDLYAGVEHKVGPDAAESIKIITRFASQRIARYAFEYALRNGRKRVTAVHKANIMKLSDGLFLESCTQVAADYAGPGRVRRPDRRQHVHAAGPEAGALRRAGPAEPVRRHRQRPGGGAGRRPGRRPRLEHRGEGGGLRGGPRLGARSTPGRIGPTRPPSSSPAR